MNHRSVLSLTVIALLALIPRQASATPLDELIKPEQDSSACFARVYDAAHLRAHPRQKVTAMTVLLKYEHVGGGTAAAVLSVSLGVVQRGDPDALYSDGGCDWEANRDTSDRRLIKSYPKEDGMVCMQSAQPDVFESTSAEEGGNLILDRGKDRDTLMVYLDESLGDGASALIAANTIMFVEVRRPAITLFLLRRGRYEGLSQRSKTP